MLTQQIIDRARDQALTWGQGQRYSIVNEALKGAEELLKMVQNEVGKPIDRVTLREALDLARVIEGANLDAEIEQIVARSTTQTRNRYRVILTSFALGDGGKPPELLGTAEELVAVIAHISLTEGETTAANE